ncbi:MAG: protein translocase subunit SecF [Actinomycetota bacterium]
MSGEPRRKSLIGRLVDGETSFDFFGRRRVAFVVSGVLLVLTLASLLTRGLNLGIDFEGGVAWQVPKTESIEVDDVRTILEENGIRSDNAKIQVLDSGSQQTIRVQVGDQTEEVRIAVQGELAEKASVESNDVSVSSVSSSWGRSITEKAVRALAIFLGLVALYIAWRFEWRMALAALIAMVHDVVISVGLYSLFGFEVTPATVVAFLTILGYSLYDTIVVFDRVQDNVAKFSGTRISMGDISNISMNQVLMRSINTSVSSILPVLSILILGSGVLGAVSLREFAVALLVGMITGAYSSIYVATPLLTLFKERETRYASLRGQLTTGDELEFLVATGAMTGAKPVRRHHVTANGEPDKQISPAAPTALLTHPPRPRKKKRR